MSVTIYLNKETPLKRINTVLTSEGILKPRSKSLTKKETEPSPAYNLLNEAELSGETSDTFTKFQVSDKQELKKIKNQVLYAIRRLRDKWYFETAIVETETEEGFTIYVGKYALEEVTS